MNQESFEPTEEEINKALKWPEQPLDRVIVEDLPMAYAFHVLAQSYRAKVRRTEELEAEVLRLKAVCAEKDLALIDGLRTVKYAEGDKSPTVLAMEKAITSDGSEILKWLEWPMYAVEAHEKSKGRAK
ncbi:MAG: hypothetical protein KGL39_14395 [Patescibacteria group bacterium]|nr:hypothetical protein [Patescibacteria group bacterium]